MSVTLRLATASDADDIARFYAPYAEETAINFEYEAPDAEEFARRIEEVEQKFPFIVAQANGRVLGYAFARGMGERPAYGWSIDTSIYLDKSIRGHHVGSALYGALEAILIEQGVINMFACITVRRDDGLYDLSGVPGLTDANASASDPHLPLTSPRFHAARGFHVVGRERSCGYKLGTWYDKLWMEKQVGERLEQPVPVTALPELPDEKVAAILTHYSDRMAGGPTTF